MQKIFHAIFLLCFTIFLGLNFLNKTHANQAVIFDAKKFFGGLKENATKMSYINTNEENSDQKLKNLRESMYLHNFDSYQQNKSSAFDLPYGRSIRQASDKFTGLVSVNLPDMYALNMPTTKDSSAGGNISKNNTVSTDKVTTQYNLEKYQFIAKQKLPSANEIGQAHDIIGEIRESTNDDIPFSRDGRIDFHYYFTGPTELITSDKQMLENFLIEDAEAIMQEIQNICHQNSNKKCLQACINKTFKFHKLNINVKKVTELLLKYFEEKGHILDDIKLVIFLTVDRFDMKEQQYHVQKIDIGIRKKIEGIK